LDKLLSTFDCDVLQLSLQILSILAERSDCAGDVEAELDGLELLPFPQPISKAAEKNEIHK